MQTVTVGYWAHGTHECTERSTAGNDTGAGHAAGLATSAHRRGVDEVGVSPATCGQCRETLSGQGRATMVPQCQHTTAQQQQHSQVPPAGQGGLDRDHNTHSSPHKGCNGGVGSVNLASSHTGWWPLASLQASHKGAAEIVTQTTGTQSTAYFSSAH